MALTPINEAHKKQIEAGIKGRDNGHKFESILSSEINSLSDKSFFPLKNNKHLFQGNPAIQLIQYISNALTIEIVNVKSSWLGGLATSGLGDAIVDEQGNPITKSKSDILLRITCKDNSDKTIGVSIKTCNKRTPTNDQMFFTTARAFCTLLRTNEIEVSDIAEDGLSMFCGDTGFRPLDLMSESQLSQRVSDPNRYYWEETTIESQKEWESIFLTHQDDISLLLFQKAYRDDTYAPDFLLHQTTKFDDFNSCETAIFTMDEIATISHQYSGFVLSKYVIRKGTYKNDNNVHFAPRFGFIQFQRGGQKQHPTQLQFNLKAGYFRHI
ncbi:MAG: hypothetical protein LUE25_04565 [Clostridiales bacterium]|nr:hypothetical protein [Clostridiales bacterium]